MPKNLHNLTSKAILHQLSTGAEIKDISEFFTINKWPIKSQRSVMYYLKELRERNGCSTVYQLMYEWGKNPESIIINQKK